MPIAQPCAPVVSQPAISGRGMRSPSFSQYSPPSSILPDVDHAAVGGRDYDPGLSRARGGAWGSRKNHTRRRNISATSQTSAMQANMTP